MRGIILLLPLLLSGENYEEKYLKDDTFHPSNIAIHTDLGYSSYLIELHSSEIDSAIDYDILEFTLGASYSYDDWMWGAYSKFVVDEVISNMNTKGESLGDKANIDRDEFAIYTNYTLRESESDAWRVNGILRVSSLDASDSYISYHHYTSQFRYQTQDLAISLVYSQNPNRDSSWFANSGLLYSQAQVEMYEGVDNNLQDSFVDDSSFAIGVKLSMGYNYRILSNLFFTLRGDYWHSDFEKLEVESRVGDRLPKARLREQVYSVHTGVTLTL
ncbi:hypothetical protein MNB_SV-12-1251 [hydrothermal vent metagenome]|uniref:Uncharacterized protein n=1 Tax=hydrothermal vent metagenome TaxID=652676 RepID=A0A1W1C2B3_9ZZZZ